MYLTSHAKIRPEPSDKQLQLHWTLWESIWRTANEQDTSHESRCLILPGLPWNPFEVNLTFYLCCSVKIHSFILFLISVWSTKVLSKYKEKPKCPYKYRYKLWHKNSTEALKAAQQSHLTFACSWVMSASASWPEIVLLIQKEMIVNRAMRWETRQESNETRWDKWDKTGWDKRQDRRVVRQERVMRWETGQDEMWDVSNG